MNVSAALYPRRVLSLTNTEFWSPPFSLRPPPPLSFSRCIDFCHSGISFLPPCLVPCILQWQPGTQRPAPFACSILCLRFLLSSIAFHVSLEIQASFMFPLLNPSTSSPVCTTASLHLSQIASMSSLSSPPAASSSFFLISSEVNLFFNSSWYDFRTVSVPKFSTSIFFFLPSAFEVSLVSPLAWPPVGSDPMPHQRLC